MLNLKVETDPDAYSIFGCNIASGIILENYNIIKEENPKDERVKYKKLYINGLTLYRNFIDCLTGNTDYKLKLLKNDVILKTKIKEHFLEDVKYFIQGAIDTGFEDISIYILNYKKVEKNWNNFRDESNMTPIKYYVWKTFDYIKDKLRESFLEFTRVYTDHRIPSLDQSYIVTHIGLDLLNFSYNNNIMVIESHTGEFKGFDKWYTKYHKFGNRDMSIFPFNELLYRFLGDEWFVKPENIPFRRWLYELAKKSYWNQYTREAKILADIRLKDRFIYNKIKQIKKLYP